MLRVRERVLFFGTPFSNLYTDGDTATVETMLSTSGAQSLINYQEAEHGATPLHCAAGEGHASVTAQLIAARCNVDLQDKNGATPLFLTAQFGHASITGQLLAARCNMDVQACNWFTPLYAASNSGHASVTA
jgi:ankyrin repeat protein